MTSAAFLDLIRQFKSAAGRKHVSFAIGVNACLALWRESVMASDIALDDKKSYIAWGGDVVMREYAPADKTYELPPGY